MRTHDATSLSSLVFTVSLLITFSAPLAIVADSTSTAPVKYSTVFIRDLELGMIGDDVKELQIFLNSKGFPVSLDGELGSSGKETTKFGAGTFAALKKYQASIGLLSSGYFGSMTRNYINSGLSVSTTNPLPDSSSIASSLGVSQSVYDRLKNALFNEFKQILTKQSDANMEAAARSAANVSDNAINTLKSGITSSQWMSNAGGSISYNGGNVSIGTTVLPNVVNVKAPAIGAKGDDSADDTAAFAAAIAAAVAAGGHQVIDIPPGTYQHTGITLPAGGNVILRCAGKGATILKNTHPSNPSISVVGPGNGSYAERWGVENCTLTALTVNTNQPGIYIKLARDYEVRNVEVNGHGIGIRHVLSWRGLYENVRAVSNTIGWQFEEAGGINSTPNTIINGSALSNTSYGVYFLSGVDVLSWMGGDIGANGGTQAVYAPATSIKAVTFTGVNFESNTGPYDVYLGGASGTDNVPANIAFSGCRFYRAAGSPGTTSIYAERVNGLTLVNNRWENYANSVQANPVIYGSSNAAGLTALGSIGYNSAYFLNWSGNPVSGFGPAAFITGANFNYFGLSNLSRVQGYLGVSLSSGNGTVSAASNTKFGLGTATFASLGTATNGLSVYCSDCDAPGVPGAACTSAGAKAGAEARVIRGVWSCF